MPYKSEISQVKSVFPDAEIIEVNAAYEAFHAMVDGIRLIFYPHKVGGTGNVHIRLRNGSHTRKNEFLCLAAILQSSQSPQSTFHVKNHQMLSVYTDVTKKLKADYPKYQKYWDTAEQIKKGNEIK